MDVKPIDADNHYYEPLDAFTRHLDKAFRDRGVKPVAAVLDLLQRENAARALSPLQE